jgi:hypothetical protein
MLKILAIIGLIGSIIWAVAKPNYDSILAVITAMAAAIGSFKNQNNKSGQNQTVHKNGIGIQAGNDVSIGDIYKKPEDK